MIWWSATGGIARKNAKVATAPARKTTKIGVPSTSSMTGRAASVQVMGDTSCGVRTLGHRRMGKRGDIACEQHRRYDRRAGEADDQGEMRDRHREAERHAGLSDRGDAADEGPGLDGRKAARDRHGQMLHAGQHE